MKIGILTASRTDNNGTDLQAYAMQELFLSAGADAELIDYRCPKLENSRRILKGASLKAVLSVPYRLYDHLSRERFRKRRFRYSSRAYTGAELKDTGYDAVVVGSDQVWNMDITGGDTGFFLPDISGGCAKLSYAVSMGSGDIAGWDEKHGIIEMLRDFKAVSLREERDAETLRALGVTARHDLDPLLALGAEKWQKLIENPRIRRPYVLVYPVGGAKKAVSAANVIAEKLGAATVLIADPIKPIPNAVTKRFVSMPRWLGYVANASAVVTDSYHCLAFCMLFGVPFARLELPNAASNNRLTGLIEMLGIEEGKAGELVRFDKNRIAERLEALGEASRAYIGRIVQGEYDR